VGFFSCLNLKKDTLMSQNNQGPVGRGNVLSILSDLKALDFSPPSCGIHWSAISRVVRELAALIERTSPRHQGHGRRTADYAHRLGLALRLPWDDLRDLTLAALLHDIGFLTLPAELVKEHHDLTPQEFARYQSHPRAGAELLESISFLKRPALWIAHHHERWDGCGYPYGLRGEFIPLGSRILAIADTFDVYLHQPSHTHASNLASATALLQVLAGAQLDPLLVERFLQVLSTLSLADPTFSESL
jgi:HD-GYP domain-containing protein (c-di-GMP phosphodiesterase class II)